MQSESSKFAPRITVFCSLGALLLGLAGLVGWWFGITLLTRVLPGYKAIAPSVAVSLILLGLVLLRLAYKSPHHRKHLLSAAVVGFISLYGLLEVIGFFLHADLNREDALTHYLARLFSLPLSTMSPVAGLLLFLSGASLLALLLEPLADNRRQSQRDTSGTLAFAAGIVATVFSLGYVYGAPLLYNGPAIPIAATACLGGLLLAIGIIAAGGTARWPLRAVAGDSARSRLLRAFVPLTALAVLTISIAYHHLPVMANLNHVIIGALLAVVSALIAGLVASRIAHAIGASIDQAQLAQQRAEQSLRASEERWATTTASIGDALISTDTEGRIIFMNTVAEALTGWTLAEAATRPITEVLNIINEHTRQAVPNPILKVLQEGKIVGLANHTILVRKDGTEVPIDDSGTPIRDREGKTTGAVLVFRDISERKQAEEALRNSQADLNRAQAVAHVGSWRLDVRKNELLWSEETHRLFGVPTDTAMTYETFLTFVHPEDREDVERKWSAALQGEKYDIEHRILVGGVLKWVRESAELEFDREGILLGGFGTVQDITQRKQQEEELARAAEQLLQAERLRAQMAETVALEINHRMKNNLMLISGILEMQLSDQPVASDAALTLREAKARIAALSTVHEQISEKQTGQVELGDMLQRIAELAVSALAAQEVALSLQAATVLIPSRAANTFAMVSNELLTNAIKYGAPGPDGKRAVEVNLSRRNGSLYLRVWNSGNPVPADFDPAQQSGLGLRLCRELITGELHGSFQLRPHNGGTLSEITVGEHFLEQIVG